MDQQVEEKVQKFRYISKISDFQRKNSIAKGKDVDRESGKTRKKSRKSQGIPCLIFGRHPVLMKWNFSIFWAPTIQHFPPFWHISNTISAFVWEMGLGCHKSKNSRQEKFQDTPSSIIGSVVGHMILRTIKCSRRFSSSSRRLNEMLIPVKWFSVEMVIIFFSISKSFDIIESQVNNKYDLQYMHVAEVEDYLIVVLLNFSITDSL